MSAKQLAPWSARVRDIDDAGAGTHLSGSEHAAMPSDAGRTAMHPAHQPRWGLLILGLSIAAFTAFVGCQTPPKVKAPEPSPWLRREIERRRETEYSCSPWQPTRGQPGQTRRQPLSARSPIAT